MGILAVSTIIMSFWNRYSGLIDFLGSELVSRVVFVNILSARLFPSPCCLPRLSSNPWGLKVTLLVSEHVAYAYFHSSFQNERGTSVFLIEVFQEMLILHGHPDFRSLLCTSILRF